ncbi:MAG: 6-bladed beta-propeller [Bacteroidales bacterium]|nr:6-bladed beta-propeller [Bacteroidales bacterium]
MKKFLILLGGLLVAACTNSGNDVLVVNVSHPRSAMLEDLTDHITITPLDESEVLIPNIVYAKKYGNLLFLGNTTQGLVVFNGEKAVGQLDKTGRANDEYRMLYSIAYREETSELVIFDPVQRKLITYHVPDLVFAQSESFPFKGMVPRGQESVGSRYSFFLREDGPVLWDHQTHQIADSCSLSFVQAWCANAIEPMRESDSKSLLFCIPGPISRIMRASPEGFEAVREFTVQPAIGDAFWTETDEDTWHEMVIGMISSDKLALGAKDPLLKGDDAAWWYLTARGDLEEDEDIPNWNLFRTVDGKQEVYSELHLEGYPTPIQPQIADGEQWGMVLELAILKKITNPKGPVYPRLRELADQGYEHALIMYDIL